MAKLTARDRANLPDSAFAYVDSNGKRRLPINDESLSWHSSILPKGRSLHQTRGGSPPVMGGWFG